MKFYTLLGMFLGALITNSQTIKYINPNATGNGSGTSWANAYTSLKSALLNAQHKDEFWLTYSANHAIDPNQNKVYLTIDKNIALYGGFKGTETLRSQRTALPSIISGSIGMAGVDDNSENAFEIKSKVHLEGIRFTDFYSTETSYQDKVSIVKIDDKASVSFKNCDFRANESVRCIDISNNANVTIEQSTFYTNNRQKSAPIIKILNSDLHINNSDFQFNGNGSFIVDAYSNDTTFEGRTITISNTKFLENKAGIVYNTISKVDIKNCVIKNDNFYNATVNHYPKDKTLHIDHTDFSGYLTGLIINFGQIDSLIITHNNFDLALANNAHAIYGGAKNVRIKNCNFANFDNTVDPVYIYGADSSVEISNIHFKDLNRDDNLFWISGQKSIKLDSCSFENIVLEKNNTLFYLYSDSMLISNTQFIGLTGDIFPSYNPYKKFSNCVFKNINIKSNPLFYQSNGGFVSEIKNCTFDNLSIGYSTVMSYGYPFIYNGSGDLILKNNSFTNIKSNDYFIRVGSYGDVKSYGNLFENIEANVGIWSNEGGNIGIYNSNFNKISKPLFINYDTYIMYAKNPRLYVLNSVIYSANDTLLKEITSDSIPTTFEGNYTNKSLGANNYNNASMPYSELYKEENYSVLFDKGIKSDSTLDHIQKDILGNSRLLFDKIDIGYIEFVKDPTVTLIGHESAMTSATTVYPNPAKDKIFVTLSQSSKIKITNLYGQSFFEAELHVGKNEIDLSEIEAGLYILTTYNNNKAVSTKFSVE